MMKKIFTAAVLSWAILVGGCQDEKQIEILPRQELFSLYLGKMEDQLDLFQIEGVPLLYKNRVFLNNTMFYIANGNSSKVMKFTSYGDLLFLLYNPDTNPEPLIMKENQEDGLVLNRFAARYGLRHTGEIAVDSEDNIYLEDAVADNQKIWDEKLGIYLGSRILKFNKKGQLTDTIGREGAGNSLLPYVARISVNSSNEPVIICRTPAAWQVYWCAADGKLLYAVHLENNTVPPEKNWLGNIDNIIPGHVKDQLFLQVSYYEEIIDPETKTKTNIDNVTSRIYTYNLETGKYEKYIRIPEPGLRKYYTSTGEVEIAAPSYEFFGITANEYYFLIRPDEDGRCQLVILNQAGRIFADRFLLIEETDLSSQYLGLTADGLMYGLLGRKTKADLVWWRSDKLIGALKNEDS